MNGPKKFGFPSSEMPEVECQVCTDVCTCQEEELTLSDLYAQRYEESRDK